MKIADFDLEKQVMIIAEIGNNHEGSCDVAEQMIVAAAESGADAVKFQTLRAAKLICQDNTARFERLQSFELTDAEFTKLARVATDAGVLFLSTPFDLDSAVLVNELCPAFKIASCDVTFLPLLERVAGCGKPILLSTGASTLKAIGYARALIANAWGGPGETQQTLLHCVSAYPTPPDQANLGMIRTLQRHFGGCVGYSDHTLGIEAAVLSVALGARVIEKHFTLDHSYSDFRDHQLSATPDELSALVQRVRLAEQMLGDGQKRLQAEEAKIAPALIRSVVAAHDIPAGRSLQWADLNWVRLEGGIPPGQENLVLGKQTCRDVRQGEKLDLSVVADA